METYQVSIADLVAYDDSKVVNDWYADREIQLDVSAFKNKADMELIQFIFNAADLTLDVDAYEYRLCDYDDDYGLFHIEILQDGEIEDMLRVRRL